MSASAGWLRDSAAWGTAGAVVLAAHVAGAVWLMNRAEAAQVAGLPEAVYVDLAPMPMAAAPLAQLEQVDQKESLNDDPEPEPEEEPEEAEISDFTPPPLPDLEPLPDMSTLIAAQDAVVLERSELPPKRPEREEPQREEPIKKIVEKKIDKKKDEPKKRENKAQPSTESRRTTQVQAPQAERTAAPNVARGTTSNPRQIATWESKINSAVARHMRRTRVGNARGNVTATLVFTLTPGGQASGMRIASSTGNPTIDAAISRQAARMPNLPPHPSGTSRPLSIPVRISLQ
ncbi:TonB C-terminal domain-containing protein [Paracoccus sp. (in: a-proteobacteria)]|uniref:TonB C-terminal domain-containing protein n=1 Tax=Paracoccus sp. TaxID=267 RepID=UPI00289C7B8E|nr:TonB C-terminal domain-containing protein [Paracoccus sp. (in: a-proteobacteria)]